MQLTEEQREVSEALDLAWREREENPERDMELAQQIGDLEEEARKLGL